MTNKGSTKSARLARLFFRPLPGDFQELRKAVHSECTSAVGRLVEVVLGGLVITWAAKPGYVGTQPFQCLSSRQVVLVNTQNDCCTKILLRMGNRGKARPMLGYYVLNSIRFDPTRGEYWVLMNPLNKLG